MRSLQVVNLRVRPESGLVYDALLVNAIEVCAAMGFLQNKKALGTPRGRWALL